MLRFLFFLISLTIVIMFLCEVESYKYKPRTYFELGETYSINGTNNLMEVVEDLDRRNVKLPKSQKLALKICKFVGLGYYRCGKPSSVLSIGLPSTKKTLIVDNIIYIVKTNGARKGTPITLISTIKENNIVELIPSEKKKFKELVSVDPIAKYRLQVPEYYYGHSLIKGPNNQLVFTVTSENSYFFTLSTEESVLLPSKTEVLGFENEYNYPLFHDGTNFVYAGGGDQLKFFDGTMLHIPDIDIYRGATFVNGTLWLTQDYILNSFSLYNLTTGFIRHFYPNEHSKLWRDNEHKDGWTVSLDGSILYGVIQIGNDILILGVSTVTGNDVSLFEGKSKYSYFCGVYMTSAGVAVCTMEDWDSNHETELHISIYDVK